MRDGGRDAGRGGMGSNGGESASVHDMSMFVRVKVMQKS